LQVATLTCGLILACTTGLGKVAAELSDPSWETGKPAHLVRLAISLESRNGTGDLAAALVRISELMSEPQFSQVLSRSDQPTFEESGCISKISLNDSAHLFDVARCLGLWIEKGKAYEPKVLLDRLGSQLASRDLARLPAVSVAWFGPFGYRILPSQIPTRLVPRKFTTSSSGIAYVTPAAESFLCDPSITFVPRDQCKVEVATRRTAPQPDFFVSQIGYRIDFKNPMPFPLASSLGKQIRSAVMMPYESDDPNVPITTRVKVSYGPTGTERPQALGIGSSEPPSDLMDHFALPWKSVHGEPNEVEQLPPKQSGPNILVFDKLPPTRAVDLATWFGRLSDSFARLSKTACDWKQEEHYEQWHSDAMASLLFPASIPQMLKQLGEGSISDDSSEQSEWDGYILSQSHFSGIEKIPGKDLYWYNPGALSDSYNAPTVAVIVFSDLHGGQDDSRADDAFDNILSNASNILVVSAPNKASVENASNFSSNPPSRIDKEVVRQNCAARPWPSCLGIHPRVIVVAPTDVGSSAVAAPHLYNRDDFVLGRSTIQLAAPGRPVPVVSPCVPENPVKVSPPDHYPWAIHDADGSSFAAPIVGAVLARLIQIGGTGVQEQPEAAIWRMLATSDPLPGRVAGQDTTGLVFFGQVNIHRALRGASISDVGNDGRSVIYTRHGGSVAPERMAVVSAYPWSDTDIAITPGESQQKGFAAHSAGTPNNIQPRFNQFGRGTLEYYATDDNGRYLPRAINFLNVLGLVRKDDGSPGTEPVFDLYFLESLDKVSTRSVQVARNIRLGGKIEQYGFCRVDGVSAGGGATAAQDTQPGCLYEWDPDAPSGAGFRPIDLTQIDAIFTPPLHFLMSFIKGIKNTDVSGITQKGSPWRDVFCSVGPRHRISQLLSPKWTQVASLHCK
jgi:hypothetical protein